MSFFQSNLSSDASLRIIPLGGFGNVTKNMYAYEYRQSKDIISDIIVVDCGIGFPDEAMFGIDLVIPDITYLKDKLDKVRAIILTHGHEDHIGALPYLLPELNVPVYGTRLTSALAQVKLENFGLQNHINSAKVTDVLHFGAFTVEFVNVTHSIPDASNLIIRTPIGIFYHGCDYKFDWTPIYGDRTDVGKIARVAQEGFTCVLSDCVRIESPGVTLSEQVIEDTLEKEIRKATGKFIFTTQSSNVSRIQQAVNVAIRNNRKICFLGRSILQNVEVTRKLKYLNFPDMYVIAEKDIKKHQPKEIALILTGSQAQPNSALVRIAEGNHKSVSIAEGDVVVFSADPIPGYENAVHNLIDTLTESGARVAYSDIIDELHVSGHGSQNDIALMLALTKGKNVLPIGGTVRQMKRFQELAMRMGYSRQNVIFPKENNIIEFFPDKSFKMNDKVALRNIMVDGLGVGDIGNVVLRDRQTMASDGILIVIVPIESQSGKVTGEPDIISRGFVYIKESGELLNEAKKVVLNSLHLKSGRIHDWGYVRKQIEGNLEEFLYKETHRRPLILGVIIEV